MGEIRKGVLMNKIAEEVLGVNFESPRGGQKDNSPNEGCSRFSERITCYGHCPGIIENETS